MRINNSRNPCDPNMNHEEEFDESDESDEFDDVPYYYYYYDYYYPAVLSVNSNHPLSSFKLRRIRMLEQQEQELLMRIRELKEEMRMEMQQELWMAQHDQLIPTDHTTVDYSRFISFLELDDSFLTPWNWKPDDVAGEEGETKPEEPRSLGSDGGPKQYMSFEPGSFFAREVHDFEKSEETPADPSEQADD